MFPPRGANTSSALFSPRAVHGKKTISRSVAIRTRGLILRVATASCLMLLLFLRSRATTTTPTETPVLRQPTAVRIVRLAELCNPWDFNL